MLAELPPTPQPVSSPKRGMAAASLNKSPRKSPVKVCVGKAGAAGRKTTRVSTRRSLASPPIVVPSYETEVLPPIPAPTFDIKPLPLAASLLPNSFMLPPPSPHTSLPSQPALPPSNPPNVDQPSSNDSTSISPPTLAAPAGAAGSMLTPAGRRAFPVAKPLAQRMIHAYSPARPSPLSRILMLGNSPSSLDGLTDGDSDVSNLQPVVEEDEAALGFEEIPKVPVPVCPLQSSLAAQLSVEFPPESPLQEKKLEPNVGARLSADVDAAKVTATGRVFHPDPKRLSANEKGKPKATSMNAQSRVRTMAAVEKENTNMKPGGKVFSAPSGGSKISPSCSGAGGIKKAAAVKQSAPPTGGTSASRARLTAKLLPQNKGGPRRVLVDSIEAPMISRGWKG